MSQALDLAQIRVVTNRPVAITSPDHIHPWGTIHDNSRHPAFNDKLERLIPDGALSVLDLGCAGGGFVSDMISRGHFAVGIEGSDYSKLRGRAEWGANRIPHALFTADITHPFDIVRETLCLFSVITLWEVIEHVAEEDLASVFSNVRSHIRYGGIVIMSISPNEEVQDGVSLHQTVQPREWWEERTRRMGWVNHPAIVDYFGDDMLRGGKNAPGSFHLVLTGFGEQPNIRPGVI